MTNKMALVVAVVLGVLSIVLIRQYVQKLQQDHQLSLMLKPAFVASRDLEIGTQIADDMIATADFPGQAMERMFGQSRITDKATIMGAKLTTKVIAGQVLTRDHFPANLVIQKSLRGKFKNDYRAITVGIDPIRGVAGMLRPGDYIDIIATIQFSNADETAGPPMVVTRTILKNVLILATDDKLSPEDVRPGEAYASLTLRLTPKDCNRLVWTMSKGATITTTYVQQGAPEEPGWNSVMPETLFDEVRAEIEAILTQSRGG